MNLTRLKKQGLQRRIAELVNKMQETEDFIKNAIKKASNASSGDTEALRANLAILKERTNKKIEIYKQRLRELRRKVA